MALQTAQQWEYLAKNLKKVAGMSTENEFNKLGQQGWEFVAVAQDYAIFKRPKRSKRRSSCSVRFASRRSSCVVSTSAPLSLSSVSCVTHRFRVARLAGCTRASAATFTPSSFTSL
jgi:hypothetical protein